jgi:hypothetical protein
MTIRRKILLGLLAAALVIVIVQVFRPNETLELFCYLFAVPVLVLNMWEWTSLSASEWETLRTRPQPVWPRRAAQPAVDGPAGSSEPSQTIETEAVPAGEQADAPAGEAEVGEKEISLRTYGILLMLAGVSIMAVILAHVDFGFGKLFMGMLGFIAFIAGLYLTFG